MNECDVYTHRPVNRLRVVVVTNDGWDVTNHLHAVLLGWERVAGLDGEVRRTFKVEDEIIDTQ